METLPPAVDGAAAATPAPGADLGSPRMPAADRRCEDAAASSATTSTNKRVSNTCVTCRARKVRCPGPKTTTTATGAAAGTTTAGGGAAAGLGDVICSNCERLGFPCSFDDGVAVSFDNSLLLGTGTAGANGAANGASSAEGAIGDAGDAAAAGTAVGGGPAFAQQEPAGAATAAAAPQIVHSIPRRRARQACQNCHARKARCSGGVPQCDRCLSLGIECVYRIGKRSRLSPVLAGSVVWADPALNSNHGSSSNNSNSSKFADLRGEDFSLQRSRSASSDRIDASQARPLPAMSAGGGAPRAGPSALGAPPRAATTSLAQGSLSQPGGDVLDGLAMRTFDQFFRHIHHIPTFAFLHRASVMQRYRAGLVDRPLLLALVGVASLMTDLGGGPATRELGKQCVAEAEALVLQRLDRPSTLGLQTLVFVIHHRVLSGRFSSAFMLHGVASRFAAALRLNHENPRLCFLARESRRRLMWALYMIDSSMANGYADFSLWAYRSADVVNIQLPCNERNFEFDLPEVTERLQPPSAKPTGLDNSSSGSALPPLPPPPLPDSIGFLALHVRIRALRGRILQYTKQLTADATTVGAGAGDGGHAVGPSPLDLAEALTALPQRCAEIAAELDSFAARLPASFRWSEANARLRTYSPRLCVFLMTHVWWEQCHCELYRVALVGLQEALPAPCLAEVVRQHPEFVRHCRRQVFDHAHAMAEMFRVLLTLDNGVPVTDLDLPICLYQCVRLLFYFSQTGDDKSGAGPEPAPSATSPPYAMDTVLDPARGLGMKDEPVPLLSHGTFLDLADVCFRVLEQTITTPATVHMRTNLEKLITHGLGAEVFPSDRSTPDVAHMEVDDDGMVSNLMQQLGSRGGDAATAALAAGTQSAAASSRGRPPPAFASPALAASSPAGTGLQQQMYGLPQLSSGQAVAPTMLFGDYGGGQASPPTAATAAAADMGTTSASNVDGIHNDSGPVSNGDTQATTTASSPAHQQQEHQQQQQQPQLDQPGALNAFDLDVEGFEDGDLGGWFSGDWMATASGGGGGGFPS